jgi:hypothetical protein
VLLNAALHVSSRYCNKCDSIAAELVIVSLFYGPISSKLINKLDVAFPSASVILCFHVQSKLGNSALLEQLMYKVFLCNIGSDTGEHNTLRIDLNFWICLFFLIKTMLLEEQILFVSRGIARLDWNGIKIFPEIGAEMINFNKSRSPKLLVVGERFLLVVY